MIVILHKLIWHGVISKEYPVINIKYDENILKSKEQGEIKEIYARGSRPNWRFNS